MKNRSQQTNAELLEWCDLQHEDTMQTIDSLLDDNKWKSVKNMKALTVAGDILKNIDELRQTVLEEVLPRKAKF